MKSRREGTDGDYVELKLPDLFTLLIEGWVEKGRKKDNGFLYGRDQLLT